jgi:hypothetical protein
MTETMFYFKISQLRHGIYLEKVKHTILFIIIILCNLFKNISRQVLQIHFKLTENKFFR